MNLELGYYIVKFKGNIEIAEYIGIYINGCGDEYETWERLGTTEKFWTHEFDEIIKKINLDKEKEK